VLKFIPSFVLFSVQCHPVDECRFDINVNDNVWYLRTETADDRVIWFNAVDLHRVSKCGGILFLILNNYIGILVTFHINLCLMIVNFYSLL